MGKEHYGQNRTAPLAGIVFLERASECSIRRLGSSEIFPLLYNQIFFTDKADTIHYILANMNRIIREIPVYQLKCDISEQAVKCCYEAVTGEVYKKEVHK